MVSNLRMLFKREAAEPVEPVQEAAPAASVAAPAAAEEEITGTTTLATHIFGHKHHKHATTTLEPDGEDVISSTVPPKGEIAKVTDQAVEMAHQMGIPTWGLVAITILVLTIVLGILGFCIRRCCKKRRSKDGKKGMKGVDLKSVQLLGSAYKEKVRTCGSMLTILFSIPPLPLVSFITRVLHRSSCRCSRTWRSWRRTLKNRTRARVNRANKSSAN